MHSKTKQLLSLSIPDDGQNIFTQKKKTLHRYRYLYTLQKDKSELCLTYQFDKVLDFAF